ncbi:hypothetical protein HOF26_02420, partial [bacterium]|nr:hypothetical protein [bacterium]
PSNLTDSSPSNLTDSSPSYLTDSSPSNLTDSSPSNLTDSSPSSRTDNLTKLKAPSTTQSNANSSNKQTLKPNNTDQDFTQPLSDRQKLNDANPVSPEAINSPNITIKTPRNHRTFLSRHKKKLIFIGMVGAYCGIRWYGRYLEDKVKNNNDWGSWNSPLSFAQLITADKNELAVALVHSIQLKYTTAHTVDDCDKPMMQFMRAVAQEKRRHKRYQTWCRWMSKFYLNRIFSFRPQSLELSRQKLQRLNILEAIFMEQLAVRKARRFIS